MAVVHFRHGFLFTCFYLLLGINMPAAPGRITALKPQRKRKDRVNVFIDGQFAFGLAETAAVDLQVNQDLTAADIERLETLDDLEESKRRALNYALARPHSVAEVERYLRRKETPEWISEKVIAYLRERDYLDDLAFCHYWIEQRQTFKPRSGYAIRQELRAKGVEAPVIEAALAEYDNKTAALTAAEQRAHRWADLPQAEFELKMGRYLKNRGFHYYLIQEVMAQVWAALSHEDDDELT